MNEPKSIFLTVSMPTYNEEHTIERVVQEHIQVLNMLPPCVSQWEMVVVDDGSRDRTPSILDRLSTSHRQLRVINHPTNLGLFHAFDDAHRAAHGTHIFSTASDGEWPAENLRRMLDTLLTSDADLVVGTRPNRYEIYSPWRRIVSRWYQLLPNLLFAVKTYDAGSIKIGRRDLFQCRLISRSPFVEAERIIRAKLAGSRIAFVPIDFLPRGGGTASGAKLSYILASVRDCLLCFWQYRIRDVVPQ